MRSMDYLCYHQLTNDICETHTEISMGTNVFITSPNKHFGGYRVKENLARKVPLWLLGFGLAA